MYLYNNTWLHCLLHPSSPPLHHHFIIRRAQTMAGSGSGKSRVLSVMAPVNGSASAEGKVAFSTGFEKIEAFSEADDDERQVLLPTRTVRENNTTFERVGKASHQQPIERYEGSHRYDPQFEWEPKEEKKLVRKVGLFPFEWGIWNARRMKRKKNLSTKLCSMHHS